MAIAIVTGSGGLIGSESVRFFAEEGYDVIGLENDMRAYFFGPEASTAPVTTRLESELDGFRSLEIDLRDADGVDRVFEQHAREIELIVHAALTGDTEAIYHAVMLDPLTAAVCTLPQIHDMVGELLAAQRQWLPQF